MAAARQHRAAFPIKTRAFFRPLTPLERLRVEPGTMMPARTAAILAIGDELLSGRTRDANIHFLAGWLGERAIALKEARIVADDEAAIVEALNALRARYDYCFTSGGIGPTHDDITYDAVAKAFGRVVVEHPDAIRMIRAWYEAKGEEVTPPRRRMAMMPEGAEIILNPVSGAPGVRIDNVFVLAGVPSIFQGMLAAVDGALERGVFIHSRAVTALGLPESRIAEQLRAIQSALRGVAIGSYPIDGDIKGVTVVARSESESAADAAIASVAAAMRALGFEPQQGERQGR
jgi:molybdenum cofactor synthesis domain-containing protein